MSVRRYSVELLRSGLYARWDDVSRRLPRFAEHTTKVPAVAGAEFGYVLKIWHARRQALHFTIDHPPFPDAGGGATPPFTGTQIRSNDYEFFLGDAVREPLGDKIGRWRPRTWIGEQRLADMTFDVVTMEKGQA